MGEKKKSVREKTEAKLYKFVWRGVNKSGHKIKGEIKSNSLAAVKAELIRNGISVTKVSKTSSGLFSGREKKINSKDLTVFTRQLATMIAAGIPLAQAFEIVGRGHEKPKMQQMIMQIKTDVEGGNSLSDALRRHQQYFNELFCNLVHAGEQSGSLETMLNRLAIYREKTETLKKKIRKALTYPVVVLIIALGVTAGLLVFVVPQFEEVFKGSHAELPVLTHYIVMLSKFLQKYWYLFFISIGAMIFLFIKALKTSEKFAFKFDKLLLKTPIIGEIIRKSIIARYARTLATTFAAGMPLVEALGSVAGAAGNRLYTLAILEIQAQVTNGTQLHQAMKETNLFPSMVNQMVAIGEESGSLEMMLSKVADYYEELVDAAVDNLSTLLEPVIMVVLAVLVGTVVVAMYWPIFNLGQAVS